jgi:adenine phosphoribosyltransferase
VDWNYYFNLVNKISGRYEITPLFENPAVFSNMVEDLIKPFKRSSFDKVLGLDALGFILAAAIAYKLKKPLILARKAGKLPYKPKDLLTARFSSSSLRYYTSLEKSFAMRKGPVKRGDKVLIVDEWIETGGQVKAVIRLVERAGGKVVGIAALNAHKNAKTRVLFDRYNCRPIHVAVHKV